MGCKTVHLNRIESRPSRFYDTFAWDKSKTNHAKQSVISGTNWFPETTEYAELEDPVMAPKLRVRRSKRRNVLPKIYM